MLMIIIDINCMEMNAITLIGYLGALVLLVALILNQFGRWETTDFEYDFINFVGAVILSIYGWQIGNNPILVLFVVWALFHLKDVLVDGVRSMKKGKEAKKIAKDAAVEAKEEVKEETAEDIMKPKSDQDPT